MDTLVEGIKMCTIKEHLCALPITGDYSTGLPNDNDGDGITSGTTSMYLKSVVSLPSVGLYDVIALFMYKRTSSSTCQYNQFTHILCVSTPRLTGYEPRVAPTNAFAKIHDLIASLDQPPSLLVVQSCSSHDILVLPPSNS
jgi:hypothetical protein